MTISIENLGPVEGTPLHQYVTHINGHGYSTFQHKRDEGLAVCLRRAADGVDIKHATPHLDAATLAQEIRRVDGNHDLGAGALAEALMPLIQRLRAPELHEEKNPARDLDVGRSGKTIEDIVRSAIGRALRAEVDPVLSFNIVHRHSERDEAVKEAAAAIRAL